jgi:dUTP pyrophosphatase
MKLKIKKMYPDVSLPQYATSGAACFDIRAYNTDKQFITALENGDSAIIDTGLQFEIPEGYAMLVYSRSGHGFKSDVRLSNCVGVIDSDYRGELKVKLHQDFTEGDLPFIIMHGDRIAQAMIVELPKVEIEEVDCLSDTDRGEGGFGSTGK